MKKFRNEWKYVCTDKELLDVESRAKGVLSLDSHAGDDGKYSVHSLYFDNSSYSCAYDTESGVGRRFKYRIRYYGESTDVLRLERKEKSYGRGRKMSCYISREIYRNIMEGQMDDVFWNTENVILKQFCVDVWKKGLTPKVIIDYERVAYVDEQTNTRITLDKNIRSSAEIDEFLTGNYISVPIMKQGNHVLEVKFDDILPGYIKKALYIDSLQQTSFSKYYIGLKKIRGC